MGRATQGVTLISVDDGTKLSGLQRVVESDADNGVNGGENGNGNGGHENENGPEPENGSQSGSQPDET